MHPRCTSATFGRAPTSPRLCVDVIHLSENCFASNCDAQTSAWVNMSHWFCLMLKLIDVAWDEFDMPASENPNKGRELGEQQAERKIRQGCGSNAGECYYCLFLLLGYDLWVYDSYIYYRWSLSLVVHLESSILNQFSSLFYSMSTYFCPSKHICQWHFCANKFFVTAWETSITAAITYSSCRALAAPVSHQCCRALTLKLETIKQLVKLLSLNTICIFCIQIPDISGRQNGGI